jgi:hypothetical protein
MILSQSTKEKKGKTAGKKTPVRLPFFSRAECQSGGKFLGLSARSEWFMSKFRLPAVFFLPYDLLVSGFVATGQG